MAQEKKDGKLFIFGADARQALLRGSEIVYKAVSITFGPKGRNVALEKTYGRPVITRDGVTVARESYIEDRAENIGAAFLIEASQATNKVAGDGTTATVILAHNLIQLGLQQIAAGFNPMDIKQQILDDSHKVLDNLKSLTKPVKKGQLEQVAGVSSGDPLLGKLIAEAIETVGQDGGLITEKAPIDGVDRTYIKGYFLQQGFTAISQGKKELSSPYVVVSSRLINSSSDILILLNKLGELAHEEQGLDFNSPLREPLRIAFFGEFDADAYNTIVANIQKGIFDGTVTKTPPMGDMGVKYLEDLAIYSGGKLIAAGSNLADIDASYFGRAEKVTCTANETTVFGGQGSKEDLERRKAEIKDRIDNETVDAIIEKLRDRLAKLEGRIAVFRIGGATDTEREEKEFRIEDSIQAARAAAATGVVPGGGVVLLELSKTKSIGQIFALSLQNVFKKLMDNANLPADVKLSQVLEAPYGYGFNLKKADELVDLVAEGILDPYLVIEQVVENSASMAANVVTIDCLNIFIDKEDD